MRTRSSILLVIVLFAAATALAAGPEVNKVEPPNWWLGLPPTPMLLITGENLDGATVTSAYPGIQIERVQAQPGGRYLFVWLKVASQAAPGTAVLNVRTTEGTAKVNFPLQSRAAHSDAFAGLSPDDVIYLIMPDRFDDGDVTNDRPRDGEATYDRARPKAWHGGDLKGIRDRLPYLKELGVTAIWLTPFWKNDWRADDYSYHGYHCVDMYAVDEHLGSLSDLRQLATEAHRLRIKLIVDYVVNHVGPSHPWAAAAPTPTWLHGTPQNHLSPSYEFRPLVDPHAVPALSRNVLEGWFADKLPDLNPDDPLLARYLLQNAEWWVETTGADALRLDTMPYSSRQFWSGWHEELFRAYPRLTTIGEVWNFDPFVTSFFAGGHRQFDGIDTGVSTVFDFPTFNAIRDVLLHDGSASKLADVLGHDALYPRPQLLVTFIGSHDTRRFISETGATRQKLKVAFGLLLTMRGIPEIYSGDEIAMAGDDDPDNRRDFPGGFPGDIHDGFQKSGRNPDEQDVFAYVQALLRLRQSHAALRTGRQWHIAVDDSYYVFLREEGKDRLLVAFNRDESLKHIRLQLADTPLAAIKEANSLLGTSAAKVDAGVLELDLAPQSVTVYQVR